MIITEKQLLMLYEIVVYVSRLNMSGSAWNPPFSNKTISQLVDDIINQQSNKKIEIKGD